MAARSVAMIALGLSLVAATAARAQDSSDADFRCFAAMSRAGGADGVPDDQKAQLASGVMYFLGKLDGENPGLDIEAALADQAKKLKPRQLRREMTRCGAELRARGEVLQDIGDRFKARAEDGDRDVFAPN